MSSSMTTAPSIGLKENEFDDMDAKIWLTKFAKVCHTVNERR